MGQGSSSFYHKHDPDCKWKPTITMFGFNYKRYDALRGWIDCYLSLDIKPNRIYHYKNTVTVNFDEHKDPRVLETCCEEKAIEITHLLDKTYK